MCQNYDDIIIINNNNYDDINNVLCGIPVQLLYTVWCNFFVTHNHVKCKLILDVSVTNKLITLNIVQIAVRLMNDLKGMQKTSFKKWLVYEEFL